MPDFDGSGPSGWGPGTGRGLGRCFRGIRWRNLPLTGMRSGSKGGGLVSVLLPVAVLTVTDLLSPRSALRSIGGRVMKMLPGKRTKLLPEPGKEE